MIKRVFASKACYSGNSASLISQYKHLFVGYSVNKKHRNLGASGGLGTEIAHFGLAQDLVDSVIGVGMSTNNPLVPQYQIIHDSEDVDKLNGSKYVYMPFESLSQLLDAYKDNKKE